MIAIKVCGLREQDNTETVVALNPQWIGFIYVPSSPRYIQDANDPVEFGSLPADSKTVGVFANQSTELVIAIAQHDYLDMVQLHGSETPEYCRMLQEEGIPVIKAFSVDEQFDFTITEDYAPYVEMFLFDTKSPTNGGTGKKFDWNILNGKRFAKPFLLSGGIGPEDVELLKGFDHPDFAGIDVNSKFEIAPGMKDVVKLKSFMEQIA